MAGRFITFEGGEGGGKSTQVKRLADNLRAKSLDVVVTREPGGTRGAEAVRHVLLSGAAKTLGPDAEAMLFAAARVDHVDRLIKPALEAGSWVVCDRFTDSTRVYQGASGVGEQLLLTLEQVATNGLTPDLTIVLDLPAEVGLKRALKRAKSGKDADLDRFEKDTLDIHAERREAFLAIATANPGRCAIINANTTQKKTADAIWAEVEARFGRMREDPTEQSDDAFASVDAALESMRETR